MESHGHVNTVLLHALRVSRDFPWQKVGTTSNRRTCNSIPPSLKRVNTIVPLI